MLRPVVLEAGEGDKVSPVLAQTQVKQLPAWQTDDSPTRRQQKTGLLPHPLKANDLLAQSAIKH